MIYAGNLSGEDQIANRFIAPPVLQSPENGLRLIEGTMQFKWLPSAHSRIERHEITVMVPKESFILSRNVPFTDSARVVNYQWTDMNKDIPFYGRYLWYVEAVDSSGVRFRSEVGHFNIAPFTIEDRYEAGKQTYAVRFRYNHRIKTVSYGQLLRSIDPRTHLLSFTEIGFSFKQNRVYDSALQMQETLTVYSLTGIGFELSSKIRLVENMYFSLNPYIRAGIGWMATGLNSYTSKSIDCSLGCELVVLPRGYLTVFSEWIPLSRIHYIQKGSGLRTFDGRGWDSGFRMILPRNVLNGFSLFGSKINLERIPIEFHFSSLRDEFTGYRIDIRKIGFIFLFQ